MRLKHWNLAQVDSSLVEELSERTSLPAIVCKVLCARNPNSTVEQIESKLSHKTEFESPFKLKDMDKAVERILSAIENEENIAVYGDYDCDGITSTSLLLNYFHSIGVELLPYIPDREEEGYGMNIKAIDKLKSKGIELIITVDNGISSHREVDHANSLGIDVVITDHHTPRSTLPNAVAVINPHRSDCKSTFKCYAGVGVAFQLVCALEDASPDEMLEYYADLVAIGTVADLMPLVDENREIVNKGVELMEQRASVGITALFEQAGIKSPFTAENVSFGISPRINAAGRVGKVDEAVELLTTDDEQRAKIIAENLSQLNLKRREIEETVLAEIDSQITENPRLLLERVLIVSGKNWHQGVMGIVASRLMERYGKPSIVFSVSDDGFAKGSGRSLQGFSLIDAITECNEKLLYYGGHTLAAGMTLREEDLEYFTASMKDFARENHEIMPVSGFNIDCEISPEELTVKNITSLGVMAPFGAGNPSPVFVLRNLLLTGIYPTADDKHIRLKFDFNGSEISCIFFRMTSDRFPYQEGSTIDIVVDIDVNEWNGNLQLSIKIKDVRPSNFPQEEAIVASQRYMSFKRGEQSKRLRREDLVPTREELEIVYKYLRGIKSYKFNDFSLWEELLGHNIDFGHFLIILDMFLESGLITSQNGEYQIVPQDKKVDIYQTLTWRELNGTTR